jgi:FMN phosphatase YigB (HAD superfamily)
MFQRGISMAISLRDITGIAFDFDGVFYPYHTIPDVYSEFAKANAQAMCELLPNQITHDEAFDLAFTYFNDYGDPVTGQTKLAGQLGYETETFRAALFKLHNRYAFDKITKVAPHILAPDTRLKIAFESSNGHIRNGIASHGCATEWISPLLKAKNIDRYIQPDAIFGLNDGGFLSKERSPALIELCFSALKTPYDEQCFVEDTPKNIATMKEWNPKLCTVFIHHGNPLPRLPTYIDYQFIDIPEMKTAIAEERLTGQKIIILP